MTFYLWHKNRYSFLFPSQLCVAGNEIVWEKICIYMIDTLCVARQTSQSNATAIWRTNSTNNKSRKKLNSSKNDHSIHARFEWKSQTSQWEPRFQKPQPITIQISQIIVSCHWSPLFFLIIPVRYYHDRYFLLHCGLSLSSERVSASELCNH